MKLLIEIPEVVMEEKQYARYFGVCSGKLIETLENGIEFTGRPTGQVNCSHCDYLNFLKKIIDIEEAYDYAKNHFHYCPNCGAKMINHKTVIDKVGPVLEQIADTATNFFEDETISGLLEEGEE